MDLIAVSKNYSRDCIIFGTGLAVEIPQGFVGLIFPRSSVYKTNGSLANSVAVIDSGYSGEIQLIFRRHHTIWGHYSVGNRIGQLMVIERPKLEPEWAEDLSYTERVEKGFGSTGELVSF